MESGSFYGGGSSLTANLRDPLARSHVMTPPITPGQDIESQFHPSQYRSPPDPNAFLMNQKLDHLVSLFTEQNAAMQETQRVNDELRKEVSALRSEVASMSSKVQSQGSASTSGRKKIPSELSVSSTMVIVVCKCSHSYFPCSLLLRTFTRSLMTNLMDPKGKGLCFCK